MPDVTSNPILKVKDATVEGAAWITNLPCPSKYDWKLSDVSDADAGRTEDGLMHKMLITRKVHLELEWQNIGDGYSGMILEAFLPEYIDVQYYDYMAVAFREKRFYVGDRQVTTYSRKLGISTLSFNLIEQ